MASKASATSYNVFIPDDVVPTAETKIKLADSVSISPLGEWRHRIEPCVSHVTGGQF